MGRGIRVSLIGRDLACWFILSHLIPVGLSGPSSVISFLSSVVSCPSVPFPFSSRGLSALFFFFFSVSHTHLFPHLSIRFVFSHRASSFLFTPTPPSLLLSSPAGSNRRPPPFFSFSLNIIVFGGARALSIPVSLFERSPTAPPTPLRSRSFGRIGNKWDDDDGGCGVDGLGKSTDYLIDMKRP